ncbi:hypothetical protein [Reticulibacter mediterranei]|uniref:hypothetical protein n=1 Tax=Reticulibacter mediterranei TaxID=2778369 RepID=UPI001C693A0D|nr:hypothetical protein [Reticulibacter mediterranei]
MEAACSPGCAADDGAIFAVWLFRRCPLLRRFGEGITNSIIERSAIQRPVVLSGQRWHLCERQVSKE